MGLCASSSGTKSSDSIHPVDEPLKASDTYEKETLKVEEGKDDMVEINISSDDDSVEHFPAVPTHTKGGLPRTKYHSVGDAPTSSDDSSDYEKHDVAVSDVAPSSVVSMQLYSVISSNSSKTAGSNEKHETYHTIMLDSIAEPLKENKIKQVSQKQQMENQLLSIFKSLDENKDGLLQVSEFRRALIRRPDLGAYVRPQDVRLAFALLGLPEEKSMDFTMFRRFCLDTKEKHTSAFESRKALEWVTNLRSLFFRLGAGRDGQLSLKRLRRGLLLSPSLGHMLKAKEIDISLKKLGLPRNGSISFHDFKTYCLHLATTKKKPWAAKALQTVTLLKSIFTSLDTNKNGTLEVKELKRMIEKRPDIMRFIRPVQLRKTLVAMEVPSRGYVKYDQFETGVLLSSGGVLPEPEILVNLDAASIPSDASNGNGSPSSNEYSSEDDSLHGSIYPMNDADNASEDSLEHYFLGKNLDDSISINFTAIARSRTYSRRSFKSRGRRKSKKHEWSGQRNAHMQVQSSDDETGALGDDSDYSYEDSSAGKSRWSMQSHWDEDESYEYYHPDMVLVGSSENDDDDSSVDGFDKHGSMVNTGRIDSEDGEDFAIVDSNDGEHENKEEKAEVKQKTKHLQVLQNNKPKKSSVTRSAIPPPPVLATVSEAELIGTGNVENIESFQLGGSAGTTVRKKSHQ